MGWLVPCLPSQSRVRPRGVARYYLRCRFLVEGRCPVSDAAFAASDLSPGRLAGYSRSSGGASTVGWSRRPGSSARRPRSLTGRTMLHIHAEGNTASTWSNMMNALVGGSRTFFKIFPELLFDQVGVSAGRLRRFTASQGKSGRIGLPAACRHARSPAYALAREGRGRSPTWPVGGSGRARWANGAPTGRGAGRTARRASHGLITHESPAPWVGTGLGPVGQPRAIRSIAYLARGPKSSADMSPATISSTM